MFPWTLHVWDHGEKSAFRSPCIQSCFSCSRSQRANVPNSDNCWGFSSNPSKVYVQLSSWFACQMVPERCECRAWDWIRKQTHLPTSASSNYRNRLPKTVLSTDAKYMCHDFKKEILVLPVSWFHTAISVIKISKYCKEFAAYVVLAACIYSIAIYWRDGSHKLKKLIFCLQTV